MDITDMPLPRDRAAEDREAEAAFAASGGSPSRLERAEKILKVIHAQLECPSRNTTMTSYRRDGSVIISSDIREMVREWVMENKVLSESHEN